MAKYDAVIVGAGHNGLVCAAYLGKAGRKVCLVERRAVVGGAAVTEEVWPGFQISVASYWMSLLQPKIMMDLQLRRHGIEVIETPPAFQPFEDGRSIVFWADPGRMAAEIERFSRADAEAYPRFLAHMQGLMPYLRRLLFETPVDPTTGKLKDAARTLSLIWRFRDMRARFYDLWDLLTLSAHDYLRRWFESDQVLTAYSSYTSGSAGAISPKTPGSAYVLMRPLLRDPTTPAGPSGLVKGGMGSVSRALLKAATEVGAIVMTGRSVTRIEIEGGRARGVMLDNGERIASDIVVCNTDAPTLYLRLIERKWLRDEVIAAVKRIRTDSIAYKVNLTASALPRWTAYDRRGLDDPNPGSVTIAENIEELEESFRAAKDARMGQRPYLWITTPSAFDPTVAPPGQHVLNIMAGYVPYRLRDRAWDQAAREELFRLVMRQICRYAPGFDQVVTHWQVLVPPDIEAIFGMTGGHVHHGEMSLDQTFFRRPVAGFADYRTPIPKLYACGASTHPGGGVTGVPGHNAAREILRDWK